MRNQINKRKEELIQQLESSHVQLLDELLTIENELNKQLAMASDLTKLNEIECNYEIQFADYSVEKNMISFWDENLPQLVK